MSRGPATVGFVLLLVGVDCTRDTSMMPTAGRSIPATVTMVNRGVDLMAGEENGQPCFALSIAGLARGDHTDMSSYSCLGPPDQLVTDLLIADGTRLAVGGAVAPSVATVTVNGQLAPRDGQYFLVVLPTIPDSGVNVVASDNDGRVLSSEERSKALITTPQTPSQTSPPPGPLKPPSEFDRGDPAAVQRAVETDLEALEEAGVLIGLVDSTSGRVRVLVEGLTPPKEQLLQERYGPLLDVESGTVRPAK